MSMIQSICVLFGQDLMPAELRARRREGPMRPLSARSASLGSVPDAPPAPDQGQAGLEPLPIVDGVSDERLSAWFRRADRDGDGRLGDGEARDFLLTSGLAPHDLSLVRGRAVE